MRLSLEESRNIRLERIDQRYDGRMNGHMLIRLDLQLRQDAHG